MFYALFRREFAGFAAFEAIPLAISAKAEQVISLAERAVLHALALVLS